jgi:proteasome lid subunit RPN8/RPN11
LESYAQAGYPHEICGILLGRAGETAEIREAHSCPNLNAERSRDRYLIDPLEQMRVERDARARGLDVLGYFHSHPDHPAAASATDLELSWEDLVYLIVSVRDAKVVDRRAWRRAPGAKAFDEIPIVVG